MLFLLKLDFELSLNTIILSCKVWPYLINVRQWQLMNGIPCIQLKYFQKYSVKLSHFRTINYEYQDIQ